MGLHACEVQLRDELPLLQAAHLHIGHSLQTLEPAHDRALDHVLERLLAVHGRDAHLDHRQVRALPPPQVHALDVVGKLRAHTLQPIPHLHRSQVHVRVALEPQRHPAAAALRIAIELLHALDRAHGLLEGPRDEVLHFLRRGRRVADSHSEVPRRDLGQILKWNAAQRDCTDDDHAEHDHHRGDGPAHGEIGEFHGRGSPASVVSSSPAATAPSKSRIAGNKPKQRRSL